MPNLDESLPDIKFCPTSKFIIGKKKPPRKQKEFNTEEIDRLTSNSLNTKEEETGSSSESFVFNVKQPEKKTTDKASPRASAAASSSDSVFTSERTCSEEKASSSEFVTKEELESRSADLQKQLREAEDREYHPDM